MACVGGTQGGLLADRVPADSPGTGRAFGWGMFWRRSTDADAAAGIASAGDVENGIYDHAPTTRWFVPGHGVEDGASFRSKSIWSRRDRSTDYGSRLIALVYLLIGLYVLFRRWAAPKSTHFFVFCLVSFMLYAFRSRASREGSTGDLLGQRAGDCVAAGAVPALRDELWTAEDGA